MQHTCSHTPTLVWLDQLVQELCYRQALGWTEEWMDERLECHIECNYSPSWWVGGEIITVNPRYNDSICFQRRCH